VALIWHLSVIQLDKRTLIKGVALKKIPGKAQKKHSALRNMFRVLRSYSNLALSNERLLIKYGNATYSTKTDIKGSFDLEIETLENEIPQIFLEQNEDPLSIIQDYPVQFTNTSSAYGVISDIDDTIIISHSFQPRKRIGTLLFTIPQKRKSVAYTRSLLSYFDQKRMRVFYVSKSESNLFGMLTGFILQNNLPKGILMLTPFLNLKQLLNSKKGYNYKTDLIRSIFNRLPKNSFFLIGDDGQRDMEVYTKIANEFPNRIAKIYIRQTGLIRSDKQIQKWDQLTETHVPASYIQPYDSIEDEISYLETLRSNPPK
jgi:phosphatidate phosphatase APP1